MLKLRELENLVTTVDDDQRVPGSFTWENIQLTPEEQAMVDRFLVKYHRIFARHQLDIGINNGFKIN